MPAGAPDFTPALPTRPTANRSQSDAPVTSVTERTSLLRSSHSQGRLASTEEEATPCRRDKWTSTLKRKSAAVSDLLSGRSHSAWTVPIGAGGSEAGDSGDSDMEDIEGELSARRAAKGVGYDGEFRQELEGEKGDGVRQWYGESRTTLRTFKGNQLTSTRLHRQLPLDRLVRSGER